MITIKNSIFPFGGFKSINLFGILFCRRDLDKIDLNHENIHSQQIWECTLLIAILIGCICMITPLSGWWILLAIPSFYIWYAVEWIIRLFKNPKTAYRRISFEQEAYDNEDNLDYICKFGWFKYLK